MTTETCNQEENHNNSYDMGGKKTSTASSTPSVKICPSKQQVNIKSTEYFLNSFFFLIFNL
jgi:hypothetical protein